MLIAEVQIATDKASKYLKWLCGHFRIKVDAEYDDTHGEVHFPFGQCEMWAKPEELAIRVESEDAVSFARIKHVVGDHLERFAHKDSIRVTWVDQPEKAPE